MIRAQQSSSAGRCLKYEIEKVQALPEQQRQDTHALNADSQDQTNMVTEYSMKGTLEQSKAE